MNRRFLPVVVISAIAGRYVDGKIRAAANDAAAHEAFLKYAQDLKPFMQRPSGMD